MVQYIYSKICVYCWLQPLRIKPEEIFHDYFNIDVGLNINLPIKKIRMGGPAFFIKCKTLFVQPSMGSVLIPEC